MVPSRGPEGLTPLTSDEAKLLEGHYALGYIGIKVAAGKVHYDSGAIAELRRSPEGKLYVLVKGVGYWATVAWEATPDRIFWQKDDPAGQAVGVTWVRKAAKPLQSASAAKSGGVKVAAKSHSVKLGALSKSQPLKTRIPIRPPVPFILTRNPRPLRTAALSLQAPPPKARAKPVPARSACKPPGPGAAEAKAVLSVEAPKTAAAVTPGTVAKPGASYTEPHAVPKPVMIRLQLRQAPDKMAQALPQPAPLHQSLLSWAPPERRKELNLRTCGECCSPLQTLTDGAGMVCDTCKIQRIDVKLLVCTEGESKQEPGEGQGSRELCGRVVCENCLKLLHNERSGWRPSPTSVKRRRCDLQVVISPFQSAW